MLPTIEVAETGKEVATGSDGSALQLPQGQTAEKTTRPRRPRWTSGCAPTRPGPSPPSTPPTGARWPARRSCWPCTASSTTRWGPSAASPDASTSGRAGETATTAAGDPRPSRRRSPPTALEGYEIRSYRRRDLALRDSAIALRHDPGAGRPHRLARRAHLGHDRLPGGRGPHRLSQRHDHAAPTSTTPGIPRVSTIWGPSDPPGAFQDEAEMERNYLRWDRPEGEYPTATASTSPSCPPWRWLTRLPRPAERQGWR